MASCEQELAQLKQYLTLLQGKLEHVETELQRLLHPANDDTDLLHNARRVLEALLKSICQDIALECYGMTVGTLLSKFREKARKIVPDVVPEHIYRSMDHLNALSPPGAHVLPYSAKQAREILSALDTVLHWFVTEYKNWPLAETPPQPANSRLLATFVGRESELAQLETALQGDMPVVVEGMAGVGKSWLVDYFHSQHSARYPHYYKLSLDPRQPGTAQEHLAMLAEQLQVKVAQLPAALAQGGLLHIENADSPAAAQVAGSIAKALPRCKLVVSGRLRGVGSSEKWARVSVASFELADSMMQLQRKLAFLGAPPLAQDDARQLAQALGGLPLALHLAAGYLQDNPDVADFLEQLHEAQLALESYDDIENSERGILRSTFALSWQWMAEKAPPAQAASWQQGLAALGLLTDSFGSGLAQAVSGLAEAKPCERLLALAHKYSLVEKADAGRWKIHPLLAEFLRGQCADVSAAQQRLDNWFLSRLPEPKNAAGYSAWHALNAEQPALAAWLRGVPLQRGAEVIGHAMNYAIRNGPFPLWQAWCESLLSGDCDDAARSNILWTLGNTARSAGDVQWALTAAEEKAALDKTRGEDREYALARGLSADILQARGELDEALRIRREEEMPVYERLGDVRSRAVTLGKIADILQARGELDEALRIRREEEMPVYERLGDVRSLLITRVQLAIVLMQLDPPQADEAGALLRLALAEAQRMRIPEAGQILQVMADFGLA